MDISYSHHRKVEDAPSVASTSTLNATAASLQRLDDKLATGMSIADVAKVRWLTPMEVLQYLDQAASSYASGERGGALANLPICTAPPSAPPTTGTLMLYKASQTPNYAEDGIKWTREKRGKQWRSIAGVLARDGSTLESPESSTSGGTARGTGDDGGGESSKSSSAMQLGAVAEYLTSVDQPTFHRREYRGPSDIVLIHYLDSIRALRMSSELVDRLVALSTASRPAIPLPVRDGTVSKRRTLNDTMKILCGMVDDHNAEGTRTAEAMNEHVLNSTNDAALSAVIKHLSPDEATSIVDAMELAMEDDLLRVVEDVDLKDVTDLDINEAIDQVLGCASGKETDGAFGGDDANSDLDSVAGEVSRDVARQKGAAAIIEDRIIDCMEEVISEELRLKLIRTTETMLEVAGVKFDSSKGEKLSREESASVGSGNTASLGSSEAGTPLPEIVDITPEFHVVGYHPPKSIDATNAGAVESKTTHIPSIAISMATPLPDLPPYVDQFFAWERFAAFVDFIEIAHGEGVAPDVHDPQVRTISFQK